MFEKKLSMPRQKRHEEKLAIQKEKLKVEQEKINILKQLLMKE
jgi:hypothetical protein